MNINIETSFSEAQKAQIVSRNEQIPETFATFVVSNKYLGLLPKFRGTYIVDSDSVQINKNVEYYNDQYYQNISKKVSGRIATGTLHEGNSIDVLMAELEHSITNHETWKQEVVDKKATDKATDERNYIRDAPVRDWNNYNKRAIRDHNARVENERDTIRQEIEDKKNIEILEWINKFGSEQLKEGVRQGYRCQKSYVFERGISVLGETYVLDYDGDVRTKERSCPSMTALVEVNRLKEIGITAKIIWLPNGLAQLNDETCDDDSYDYDSCEAVEVEFEDLRGYWYCEI